MEKLITALLNTTEIVTFIFNGTGFSSIISSKIINIEEFADGITLRLQDENEIFISSLINEVVGVNSNGDATMFSLKNAHNELIEVLVVN